MVTESEIRDQLFLVLIRSKSLNDLQMWLASRAWNPAVDSPPKAALLAADVELLLSEFSEQIISENALLDRFRELTSFIVADMIASTPVPVLRINRFTATNSPSYSLVSHHAVVA
jgi:hypothetical protein